MPNAETQTENESILVVTGGAFTADLPLFRFFYGDLLGLSEFAKFVAPHKLGVLALAETQKRFDEQIFRLLEERPANTVVDFIGHSIGAPLSLHFYCEYPSVASTFISLAGVHDGTAIWSHLNKPLKANTEACRDMLTSRGTRDETFVAIQNDLAVPFRSALPFFPGSQGFYVGKNPQPEMDPSIIHVDASTGYDAHLTLVRNDAVVGICRDKIR